MSLNKLTQSLTKIQNQEMIKLLTEKSIEIRKLQDDKTKLQQRISELTNYVKGLKAIVKEKDKQIEDLEKLFASNDNISSSQKPKIRGSSSQPNLNLTDKLNSARSFRETPKSRRTPRITIEESLSSLLDEFMNNKPVTTLSRTTSQVQVLKNALSSPYFMPASHLKKKRQASLSKPKEIGNLTEEMENILKKLELVLEGWKAAAYAT